jgi:hypothetical protein
MGRKKRNTSDLENSFQQCFRDMECMVKEIHERDREKKILKFY